MTEERPLEKSLAQDPAQQERLTEELLERLLESTSPEQYLDDAAAETENRTLADYAHALLAEKNLKRSDVIRASGLNATFAYQIFQGTRMAGRDSAIMLALGLQCSLRETQRLLRFAGVSELWCKLRRDAIIIFCIKQGYTREETDDELYRLGEKTLLTEEA